MTRNDLLRLILVAADDVGRVFDHADIAAWPAGAVDEFCHRQLIRQAAGGLHAHCPNCVDGHIEPVTIRAGPDGTQRFFIWCPESMRVEVRPQMCNGWEVNRTGLAAAFAAALGLRGTPRPVVPDRLCWLGRTKWPPGSTQTREVLLAIRMRDPDAATIAAHVGSGGRAIVLVPHDAPDEQIWNHPAPAVVPLSDVLTLDASGLAVDVSAIVEMVRTADERCARADAAPLGSADKKLVRRQLKAELKRHLTDDAYLAAYKEHHSFRKAAEALTQQTGQPISKDAVRRAVERHGGRAAVVDEDDSPSVARTVASQRRDRAEKILSRR